MARVSQEQKSALTIMDYLSFHDIAFFKNFTVENISLYSCILLGIDYINEERGHDGTRAELYKHFLLCYIEIVASTPDHEFNELKSINYSELSDALLKKILNQVIKNNFSSDYFFNDCNKLKIKFKLEKLDKYLSYKLVGHCLCYKYGNSTVWLLRKLLDNGIVSVTDYEKVNNEEAKNTLETAFIRVMMFLDFEIMKKQIYIDNVFVSPANNFDLKKLKESEFGNLYPLISVLIRAKEKIEVGSESVFESPLDIENNLGKYLIEADARLGHVKFFLNDLKKCLEHIGTWYVNFYNREDDTVDIHIEPSYEDDDRTCSDKARRMMKRHGFDYKSTRTFNSYFNKNEEAYENIGDWFKYGIAHQMGIMTHDPLTYFFLIKKEGLYPSDFFN